MNDPSAASRGGVRQSVMTGGWGIWRTDDLVGFAGFPVENRVTLSWKCGRQRRGQPPTLAKLILAKAPWILPDTVTRFGPTKLTATLFRP